MGTSRPGTVAPTTQGSRFLQRRVQRQWGHKDRSSCFTSGLIRSAEPRSLGRRTGPRTIWGRSTGLEKAVAPFSWAA